MDDFLAIIVVRPSRHAMTPRPWPQPAVGAAALAGPARSDHSLTIVKRTEGARFSPNRRVYAGIENSYADRATGM